MSDTYKLQLRHGAEVKNFSTRDEVFGYINGQLQYGGVSLLPYEPVLFFYGADDDKNAIIMLGLPEGKTQNGQSYFIVDTADLKEKIGEIDSKYDEDVKALNEEDEKLWEAVNKEITERTEADETEAIARAEKDNELQEEVTLNKADLMSVIDACGLIYNEKLAEDRVSYTPDTHDEIIRDAKNVAEAIDKISKFASKLEESLKLAVEDTDTVNLVIAPNTKGENTLSANVKIAGTEGLSKKNFDNNIIGKTAEGLYASASIEPSATNPNILIFKTSGYINGQFKVDAFETEVPLAAYKGDNGKKTGVTVSVDTDKNIIGAELNIASGDTNILKLEDGEYIVEGTAKNIKYKDTNVFNALNSQSNRIEEIEDSIEFVKAFEVKGSETESATVNVDKTTKGDFNVSADVKLSTDKSIIVANGGLKANVSATFKKGTSTLLIEVGNNEYAIDLSDLAVSVLKSATYDAGTEELVLEFIVGDTTKTVRVPVGTLIHDVEVDDSDTIDMSLRAVSGGPNHISAELRVDKAHSDNMLTVNTNGAYVSKSFITDAVKVETDERKAADEGLKSKIEKVTELANTNKEAITTEATTARAAEKANADAIAQEIKDARAAEKANTDAIEKNSAAIKENQTAIDDEVARATKAEQVNATAITAEETRAKEAEVKNANAIASEIDRAVEKENDLLEKIGNNTVKIKENTTAIAAETERSTKADAEINAAVEANATAIETEKNRATHAEEDLLEKINKNSTDIQTLSTEVGDIELKKEGDLSYALYVNGTKHGEFTIPKDQFLKSVNYDSTTKELIFVFNTSAGEVTTKISIADLIDTYVAGEGLLLQGNAFSVDFSKVASMTVLNSAVTVEMERAKAVEEKIQTSLSAEIIRSENKENELASKIGNSENKVNELELAVNANTIDINTLKSGLTNEIERAKTAEKANETSISNEATRAQNAERGLETSIANNTVEIKANKNAINSETLRATTAEDNIQLSIASVSSNLNAFNSNLEGKINSEKLRAELVEQTLSEKNTAQDKQITELGNDLTTHINKSTTDLQEVRNELKGEIDKKANSVDVYTKEEILEKLESYAQTAEVQSKLNEKLNISDAQNVYATKDALQNVKDTYATIEYVSDINNQLDKRIEKNEDSIDNFNLTYNSATSELVYVDKNGASHTYKLYSGSLIKKGEFDAASNSIVLTIENAGIESQITIPVSELLSDLSDKITANSDAIQKINEAIAKLAKDWEVKSSSSVELTKTTVGEKDSLTAMVRVASSNKQAIQATGDGLYVSNDLEDYTCVFGAEGTISGQNAISKLLENATEMKSEFNTRITENTNEIARVKAQVTTNTNDIATLKTDVQTNKFDISNLKEKVSKNTSDIEDLQEKIETVTNRVSATEQRITVVENNLNSVTARITKNESDIAEIKTKLGQHDSQFIEVNKSIEYLKELIKDLSGGDVATLLEEIEKIKNVTGYDTYTNVKNMSDRLDEVEENVGEDVREEINNIKNVMIGPKDGSVDGSIWQELNNIVDAGTF